MIVVGVDGSDTARAALRWALRAAAARATGVVAVQALSVKSEIVARSQETLADEAEARAALERLCETEVGAAGADVRVEHRVVRSQPAAALLEAAEGAELVVVGRRGLGGFAGLLVGSVSRQVAEHATVPAVVVPADAAPDVRRVVVGVDGSEESAAAARWAATEAGLRGTPVLVVHAYSPARSASSVEALGGAAGGDLRTTAEAYATDAAERMCTGAGVELDVEVSVVGADPAAALLEAAGEGDLLVVGSRGRGGFAGLLLGSTSQQVLTHAPCAVAVLPIPSS